MKFLVKVRESSEDADMLLLTPLEYRECKTTMRLRSQRISTAVLLAILISLTHLGCGAPTPQIRPLEKRDYPSAFEFVRNGQTHRAEIREHFGAPETRYDHGRILVYVMRGYDLLANQYNAASKEPLTKKENRVSGNDVFDAVFVFGRDGVLKSHSVFRHGEIVVKGIRSVGGGGLF